jgi:hypothetical protein
MRILALTVRQPQCRAANLLDPDLRCRPVLPAIRNIGDQACVGRERRPAGQGRRPGHSLQTGCNRRFNSVGGRRGGERESPAFPPCGQLVSLRIDAAALFVSEAMHGEALRTLPPLHGTDAPAEIRSNLFPGVEPPLDGLARPLRRFALGVVVHEGVRIAQTHAKTRHTAGGISLRLSSENSRRTLGTRSIQGVLQGGAS